MTIPNLKTKLKQNLKKDIEKEAAGGNNSDKRFLNYYDLKDGEKMSVLFVPDVNGEFWTKFSKHGPNLRVPGADGKPRAVRVPAINCSYKSSGEDCPVCQKGFDNFSLAKDTGDKAYKEEGKRWMSRDYTLVSCIVLESPMDIIADDKGNQVKLMYLPYAIENIVREAITEGQVEEDELCSTPFIIKKSKNGGGFASYENSYFARKQVADEELEFLEDMVVDQFDYLTLDTVPKNTTTEEMVEWLETAEEAYEKAVNGASRTPKKQEEESAPVKQKSKLDMLKQKATQQDDEDESEEGNESSPAQSDEPEEEEKQEAPKSEARSRLSSIRRR